MLFRSWFYFYPAPIKAEAVVPVKIEIAKPEQKPESLKEEPKNEPVKEEPQIEPVKEKIEEEKKTPKPRIDNSIAEKVRASGGNPNGDFRASLVWHNGEDLDLQLSRSCCLWDRNTMRFCVLCNRLLSLLFHPDRIPKGQALYLLFV